MTSNTSSSQAEQTQKWRSIFDLPPDFFDSSRYFPNDGLSSLSSFETSATAINEESLKEDEDEDKEEKKSTLTRWSCNTCKDEFESLQHQRSHFKSDFHRLNVKLTIAGKSSINEEDFDESASDSLFRDNDISSISGSEDESEKMSGPRGGRYMKAGQSDKQKVFVRLHNGEFVSIWKCLLMDESINISRDSDKLYPEDTELVERLKSLIHEPRDKSKLRIVLLASGGHFAGCVFDGNTVVAHKTFHRYVVRAKAGKKQSSKDATGRAASSAGASLRRYNELALKKEIQELLAAWKPYFDASSCVFISAPSDNHQLLYNADKAYFSHSHCAVRRIPCTVRRPTFKEAKRVYSHLTNIVYEVVENRSESTVSASEEGRESQGCHQEKLGDKPSVGVAEEHQVIEKPDQIDLEFIKMSTALHEAAKNGNVQQTLELLEQGLDPCIVDERGRTPYMLAADKEVRNTFRRFMALNLDKWDWHAAKVPSPLTKEMEESQAAKQAEKNAKMKAKAKELKKLRKAKEKAQAQAAAALAQSAPTGSQSQSAAPGQSSKPHTQSAKRVQLSKEEELIAEREKRAAAAEKRMAAAAALKTQSSSANVEPSTSKLMKGAEEGVICSCCNASLAGKVPFHRYNYKYCSTSCMHVHKEMLEDG